MKKYIPVFKFVGIFAVLYLGLSGLYAYYLNQEYSGDLFPDPVTAEITQEVASALRFMGYAVSTKSYEGQDASVGIFVDEQITYRIIEGCNAISVMVLFIAFVISFPKDFLKTALFSIVGILLIHITNIIRLIILVLVKVHYPDYANITHHVIFPGIIYGMVVLLWVYWIKKPKSVI